MMRESDILDSRAHIDGWIYEDVISGFGLPKGKCRSDNKELKNELLYDEASSYHIGIVLDFIFCCQT